MTKMYFNSATTQELVSRLEEAIGMLKSVESKIDKALVPAGFNASSYCDASRELKNIEAGVTNIKSDLEKAIKNYSEHEEEAARRLGSIESTYKTDSAKRIVEQA